MSGVLIVGADGGIGRALAQEYAKRGWDIGLLGRDMASIEAATLRLQSEFPSGRFSFRACDVRDVVELPVAFEGLREKLGALDLVIYSAGVMKPDHSDDGADFAAAAEMFDVNCTAAVHLLGLAADHMQRAGKGHIAAIGSLAGERGRKGNPAYCASKAGLHTWLEGTRNRLHPLGIRVSTIKPGFVRTRMLGSKHYPGVISPAEAARLIADALEQGKQSFFVPARWGAVSLAIRMCPSVIFKRFGPA